MVYYFGYDKRCEVARRLRGYKGVSRDIKCILEECIFGPGALCLDVEGNCASCRDRILDELAALIEPSYDRDALLALADKARKLGDEEGGPASYAVRCTFRVFDRRIREALGYGSDDLSVRDGGYRS